MADLKLEVDYSQLVAAAKTTDQTKQAIRLLGQQFARTGDSSAYMRAINQIVSGQKNLSVSARMSRSEIMKLATQYKQTTVFTDKLTRSQMMLNAANQTSSAGMNRMGVAMQQTGYQVGDFLVQVQSGTNAMVAFGQQATQLVGILPMFNSFMGISGTRLIALSAGLGIAIPLFTAIAAAFMRTRQTAEETGTAFERMSSALDDIESLANPVGTSVEGSFQRINTAAQVTLQLFRDIATEQLAMARNEFLGQTGIRQGTRAFDESVVNQFTAEAMSGVGRTMADIAASMGENFRIMGLSVDQAREFDRMLQSVSGTTRDEMAQSFAQVVEKMIEAELITDETRKLVEQMGTELGLVDALQEGVTQGARDNVEAYKELLELTQEQQQADLERSSDLYRRLSGLRQEALLQEEIARYGAESAKVAELRATQERENVRLEAMKAGFFNESLDAIMEQYDAMVLSTEQGDKTTAALEELAGLSLGSLRAEIDFLIRRLNIGEEAARAMALAMPVGTSGTDAGRGGRGMTLGMAGRRANFDRDLGLGRYADRPERERAGGQDPLQQLQQRLKLEQDLLGKTEAQRRVIQALGANWRDYDESAVAALIATAEQLDNTNRKIAEQQSIADTIKDSMSDAFMSMVDGTKTVEDAFKGMARAIIKQLYDVLVVQQLVGSFNVGTGAGTGIVGSIGRALFRESGGSMMAGRPYIVGERGPELVIPGRSSTVSNADLTRKAMGGSDGVVVNQTINVNGGTDPAAIRQEVAKLMPQITNATKSAVIDARRRGGQMRAAFQ